MDAPAVKALFEPVLEPERRPTDADPASFWNYRRSSLLQRAAAGLFAAALPASLFVLDTRLFRDQPDPRGSLSAYYYSGGREIFVISLAIIGITLMGYKFFERNADASLSFLAGIGAFGVALFPTARVAECRDLTPSELALSKTCAGQTPLQRLFTEEGVQLAHFGGAILLIVCVGLISVTFGIREGNRTPEESMRQKRSPKFWRHYHFVCAAALFAALATFGVAKLTWELPNLLLGAEVVALCAFAASWFAAGVDWQVLLRKAPS